MLSRTRRYLLLLNLTSAVFCQTETDPYKMLKEAERLFWLDNWVKARPLYAQCERDFQQKGDVKNALLAKFSRLRADSESVLSYPEVSRVLAEDLRNPVVEKSPELRLRCLIVKATADLSINDPINSGREWSEALTLARQLGGKGWEERAEGELGIVAFLKGETAKAVELNERQYSAAKALNDVAGQIRSRSLKGVGLVEQEQYEGALQFLDEALALSKANPEVRFPLMAYMAKSTALEHQGKNRESRDLLEEARHFVDTTNMSVYKADLLIALGSKAAKAKDVTTARQCYEQAAAAAQKAGMPRPYADAMFHLTDLSVAAGDLHIAEKQVKEGLVADRKLIDMEYLPQHLATAAEIEARLGKPEQAGAYYEDAGDVIESVMVNVPSATVKSALIAAMSRVYRGYFRLALTDYQSVPKAFRVIEQARGRVVADRLRARPLWAGEPTDKTTPPERKLAEVQIRLLAASNANERKVLMQQLYLAEEEIIPVELARYRKEFNINGEPVSLPRLQQLLTPDELLLEYVVDEPSSFCLAITRESVQPHALPAKTALESLVKAYLVETQKETMGPPANHVAARNLYDAILKPIQEYGAKVRLILVPDGILNQVGFDSLVNPQGDYVLRSHRTTYVPSATVLSLLRNDIPKKQAWVPLLAFGDTTLNTRPDASAIRPKSTEPAHVQRGVFDLDGATFNPLPSAATEVRAIARLAGPGSQSFLGAEATETAFKSQPLARFRVLHLATHAFIDAKFPDRSAVVLSADPQGIDDGLLQVREIRNLHLNADLVTLSACDSGFGRMQGLDGMASLVNAFLFAGSRSVIASLWSVDDTFTASLMTRFYTHLADGTDTETALQKAKLDMLDRFGEKAAPVYWAGFFLSGDGNRRIAFK
jgi:CHAT domain-containing protein